MKKVIMSAAAGVMFFSAAMADQTVVTAHEEPAIVVDETAAEHCSEVTRFGGISLLLGIGGNFSELEASNGVDKGSKKVNQLIGTIGIGGGKVFGNCCYFGVEGLYDFTKSKTFDKVCKFSGSMPSLSLRLGRVLGNDKMIYVKVGGEWNEAKIKDAADTELKVSKVRPAIGLGFEKSFSNKFSGRVEGAYCFASKKSGKLKPAVDEDAVDTTLKIQDSFKVRAIISFNVGM